MSRPALAEQTAQSSATPRRSAANALRWLIALLAVALTAWTQWGGTPVSRAADEWLRDGFVRMRVTDAPEPRILVVDIDESSLARLGPWPWPRERLADLIETLLTHYSARGVALDILLPKGGDTLGDKRLALLAQNGPVLPAQAFDFDFEHKRPEPVHDGSLGGAVDGYPGGVPATGYIGNYAELAKAPNIGAIGFVPDPDGALRRVPLITSYQGRQYPTLGLALLNCCSGRGRLPLKDTGAVRVDFKRDWSAYTVVTAADILDMAIEPASAHGRYAIVGSSSLGTGDRVATPLGANRPGLGVHAAMLSMLLDQQAGLAPMAWPGRAIALVWALATGLVAALAFPRVSALASVALLGASSLAWLGIAYVTSAHDPDFSTSGPFATNLFLLAVAVPYQWQLAQRRSRHLLHTLRQYVAPAVVEELLRSDLDPLLPRQLDVTTLIADMEGYTSQVEALPVTEAAELTRTFLDCLTGPVMEQRGTLDKYTGDGLVAFWGAPLPIEDHADLALEAASQIVARVRRLSAEREALGHPPLRVRIGIDSGPAMAGDFGTSFRSIYTAVGDSVNTASRLEQAARAYPHDVIVGAGTVERARRHRFLPLGERLLRGKERPTTLFTLEGMNQAAPLPNQPQQPDKTVTGKAA